MPAACECRYPAPAASSRSTASRWPAGTPAARHAAAPPRHRGTSATTHSAPSGATPRSVTRLPRRGDGRPGRRHPNRHRGDARSLVPAAQGQAGMRRRRRPRRPGQRARIDQLPAFPAGIGAAAAAESALPVEPQPPPARPTGPGLREARAPRRAGDAVPGRSCRAGGAPAARDHGRRPMPIRSHTASRPPRRYVSMSPPASPAPRPGWYSTCGRSGVLQVPPQVRPWSAAIWP